MTGDSDSGRNFPMPQQKRPDQNSQVNQAHHRKWRRLPQPVEDETAR